MRYFVEKRFKKRAIITALILCTLLSAVRSSVGFIIYSGIESDYFENILLLLSDILSYFSLFSGYAIVSYTVFICGIKQAGEWIAALVVGFGLSYFLVQATSSLIFGSFLSIAVTVVTAVILLTWIKGCRAVPAVIVITYFIPYVSAFFLLIFSSVRGTELISSLIFEFINLGFDVLILLIVAVISGFFRNRAIIHGNGTADISLENKILPHGKPIIKVILTVDIVYTVVAAIPSIISTVEEISEYGLPVNSRDMLILFLPYVELVLHFILGYVVMLFTARIMEKNFSYAENQQT